MNTVIISAFLYAIQLCITSYDYKTPEKEICTNILLQDNWEYVSDDTEGREVFLDREDFVKSFSIQIIPTVYRDSSIHNQVVYRQDSLYIIGILSKNSHPSSIVIINKRNPASFKNGSWLISSNNTIFKPITSLCKMGKCVVFDTSINSLCYLEGNSIYIPLANKNKYFKGNTFVFSAK